LCKATFCAEIPLAQKVSLGKDFMCKACKAVYRFRQLAGSGQENIRAERCRDEEEEEEVTVRLQPSDTLPRHNP
jgi:hypothetical protein